MSVNGSLPPGRGREAPRSWLERGNGVRSGPGTWRRSPTNLRRPAQPFGARRRRRSTRPISHVSWRGSPAVIALRRRNPSASRRSSSMSTTCSRMTGSVRVASRWRSAHRPPRGCRIRRRGAPGRRGRARPARRRRQAPDRLWPRSVHPAVSSRLPVEDASDGLAERVGAEGLRYQLLQRGPRNL
jgi:hypothetical protein